MIQNVDQLVATVAGLAMEDTAIKQFTYGYDEDLSQAVKNATYPLVWMTPPVKPPFSFTSAAYNLYKFDLAVLDLSPVREEGTRGQATTEDLMDRLLMRMHKFAGAHPLVKFSMADMGPHADITLPNLQGWIVEITLGEKHTSICSSANGRAITYVITGVPGSSALWMRASSVDGTPDTIQIPWNGEADTMYKAINDLVAGLNASTDDYPDAGTFQVLRNGILWRADDPEALAPVVGGTTDLHLITPIYGI